MKIINKIGRIGYIFGWIVAISLIGYLCFIGHNDSKMLSDASKSSECATSTLESYIKMKTLQQLNNPDFVTEWDSLKYKAAHADTLNSISNKILLDQESDISSN